MEQFPQAQPKLALIQHGHWVDYYPHTQTKLQARRKLGICPQSYVFLFIGLCRIYKYIPGLIEAICKLPSNALLLIAGRFQRDDYQRKVLTMAKSDKLIKTFPGYMPDQELQDYLSACDCLVLPYLEILTSGSAMVALSFGRPVVSVKMAFLKDIVTDYDFSTNQTTLMVFIKH